MTAHAGHGVPIGVETHEEEGDARSLVEFLEVELAFEAEVPVPPLGLVEIELPEVGPLVRVVTFEPHA